MSIPRVTVEFEMLQTEDHDTTPFDWLEESDERIQAWRRGEWHFIGLVARANIEIFHPNTRPRYSTCYTLRSAGLWGIESDSEPSYIADLYKEQCAELKQDILAMGTAAFKE